MRDDSRSATDGKHVGKVFFANIGSGTAPFEVKAPPQWRVLSANLTDKDHVNTGVAVPESLPADSFGVITFVRE